MMSLPIQLWKLFSRPCCCFTAVEGGSSGFTRWFAIISGNCQSCRDGRLFLYGNDTYCIVIPCECRMAIVILAMCIPLLTAAVANPLRRLCKVAFCQPNFGA